MASMILKTQYPFSGQDVDRFLDIVYNEVKLDSDKQKCLDYLPNMAEQHGTTLVAMINMLKNWSREKWESKND